MYVIGIDIGTGSTKSVLFSEDGRDIASACEEYPLSQPKNGWAEQNPEDWWKASAQTVREVIEKSGVSVSEIASVGLSGQMHGLVMLDGENRVLRPSIIWCDQRTAKQCDDIERIVGRERLIDETANPALTGFTASKILWVRENEPEIYQRCRHILLPKDYIRFMLTGEYATEVSDASGMQLLNVSERKWSDVVLSRLEIDKSLLGEVYESVQITGRVSREAAKATGLRAGTPIVGGAGDNAAAAVGMGVVREGLAFTTIGTSGVVYAHTDCMKVDAKGRIHTFCCAVPGAWHVMGVTQGAGLSLHWLRDNCCSDLVKRADVLGLDPYILMDDAAARVTVGANRLLYLPYLMGERTPHLDADARGVFFGLSAMHTQADMIRSVMEGVGFSLNDCLSVFGEAGVTVESMAACGGGGTSALWRKILSDIYGCEIHTGKSKQGAALGAGILALTGVGAYSSVQQACDAIVCSDTVTQPDEDDHKKYMKHYELYKKLYAVNSDLFKELAAL